MNLPKLPFQKYISDFEGYSCKFSPFEANKIACCFSQYYGIIGNGRLSVFNSNPITGQLEEIHRLNTNDGMFDIAWSEANENQIISACGDGSIKLWDLKHKQPILNMKDHIGEAFSISWNNSLNNLVASSGMDSTAKVYDLTKGVCIQTLVGHKAVCYNVSWHPTVNNILASTSADRTAKIWDVNSGKIIKTIMAHNAEVLHCDFNKYDNIIATAGSDGTVNVFDLKGTGDVPLLSMKSHMLSTRKVMFSPFFASILASVGYDMNVVIWDLKKSAPINTFKHHREFVIGLDFSIFENKKIATCSWDRSLYVYNWDEAF